MGNTTIIIASIIVLGSLAVIGISLFMLNRSWGDFPGRAVLPPEVGASASGRSRSPVALSASVYDDGTGMDGTKAGEDRAAGEADNRILITHPMVLRAAESALHQNSSHARYLVREGEQLFFAFDRIQDPQQRQQAADLMRRFQAGQHVEMGVVFRLLALLDTV